MPRGRKQNNYDHLVQAYYKGASISDLAREHRCTRTGMYLLLKARNVKFRDDRSKIDIDDAIHMYSRGCLMKEIAEKYDTTVSAVSLAFKKMGIPTRRSGISAKEAKEALQVFKQDLKVDKILETEILNDLKLQMPDLNLSGDLYGFDDEDDGFEPFDSFKY